MRSETRTVVAILLVAFLLPACASAPERHLSTVRPPYVYLPNGCDPLHPTELHPDVAASRGGAEEGLLAHFERLRGHALQILQLSGGGQNGSFGAGFLKGWRESGTRPEFDMVTGVSTGALLATHAFLGTPADDAVLERVFLDVTARDIYRPRSKLSILFGASSLLQTDPFRELIEKTITAEVLERVAAACDQGRRLFVGTTNLDYNQTWVWDMTRIAKQGDAAALDLYRTVLRASASPPVAFPVVEIDGHLFGDGGVRSNLVILGLSGTKRPGPPLHGPGNFYTIHNGKAKAPAHAVTEDLKGLVGCAVAEMMSASTEYVLMRAYAAARANGYDFGIVEIPDSAPIGSNMLAFNHEQMQAGFDAGYELGKEKDPWMKAPPELGDLPQWALDVIEDPDKE